MYIGGGLVTIVIVVLLIRSCFAVERSQNRPGKIVPSSPGRRNTAVSSPPSVAPTAKRNIAAIAELDWSSCSRS